MKSYLRILRIAKNVFESNDDLIGHFENLFLNTNYILRDNRIILSISYLNLSQVSCICTLAVTVFLKSPSLYAILFPSPNGQSRTAIFWFSIHAFVVCDRQEAPPCWKVKFLLGYSFSLLGISSSGNMVQYFSSFTVACPNLRLFSAYRDTFFCVTVFLWYYLFFILNRLFILSLLYLINSVDLMFDLHQNTKITIQLNPSLIRVVIKKKQLSVFYILLWISH